MIIVNMFMISVWFADTNIYCNPLKDVKTLMCNLLLILVVFIVVLEQ